MKKKFLAMLLAVVLAVGLLPGMAWAAENDIDFIDYPATGGNIHLAYNKWIWFVTGLDESVTEAVIPSKINGITVGSMDCDFTGCTKLTSITIPETIAYIRTGAFSDCTSLTNINVANGNSTYCSVDGVLFSADKTLLHTYPAGKSAASYSIPTSVTSIGDYAFSGCSSLTSMTLPNSVTSIGSSAFQKCTGLTSVTIPDGVTSIGDFTFSGCTGLTGVTIPDGVTSIGSSTFSGCTSLASVTIPASVTGIGIYAFSNTPWQKSLGELAIVNGILLEYQGNDGDVVIPHGVTTINGTAFFNCRGLTSVTIPDSVTYIGRHAFDYCNSLTDVHYSGSESQWNQIDINNFGNDPLLSATIHFNSTGPDTTEPEPEPETPSFTDVKPTAYYAPAVAWAVENNITQGKTATTFDPNGDCTRAQFVTFLWRAAGEPDPASPESPFKDVSEAAYPYYYKAILWANEQGIAKGTGDGTTFSPGAAVTRAQAVTFMHRYAKLKGIAAKTGTANFTDVKNEGSMTYYYDAIGWAVANGITSGTGDGTTFSPAKDCTRAMMVTFLYNMLGQ